jgi:hypothetical protein
MQRSRDRVSLSLKNGHAAGARSFRFDVPLLERICLSPRSRPLRGHLTHGNSHSAAGVAWNDREPRARSARAVAPLFRTPGAHAKNLPRTNSSRVPAQTGPIARAEVSTRTNFQCFSNPLFRTLSPVFYFPQSELFFPMHFSKGVPLASVY